MTHSATSARRDPASLLDRAEFERLAAPILPALRLHCYRLVGSLDDAEDMVQEALVRAWRHRGRLADLDGLRPWLYRIATNACLDLLDGRRRRPTTSLADEPEWPDPLPDSWLAGRGGAGDPVDNALRREAIGLAFLTAVQVLPPRQRAVLVLRDVLGWSVDDVAAALDTSVSAVYSSVRRARAAIEADSPRRRHGSASDLDRGAIEVAQRYLAAWERGDAAALADLLAADARMAMPPDPRLFVGRGAIVDYFITIFGKAPQQWIRLQPTWANGLPAFVVFEPEPATGRLRRIGLMALLFRDRHIAEIRGYMRADLATRFEPET